MAKLPRSPFLNARFKAAVGEFGTALLKTGSISNPGNKGSAREEALRKFFGERLPAKYAVAEGEVVDLNGKNSPQLDIMFYDQSTNFTLNSESTNILPAEALLASIEVKSSLNAAVVMQCVESAKKLRSIKPYNKTLGGKDVGKLGKNNGKIARYYHCLFSYGTDLEDKNWIVSESRRFKQICAGEHVIDCIYVLNRGIINLSSNMFRLEDEDGGAITSFYFSILNFIERENRRRPAVPVERYVTQASKAWMRLT